MIYDYKEEVSAQLSASIYKIVIPILTPVYLALNIVDWAMKPELGLEFFWVRLTILPVIFLGCCAMKKDARRGPLFLLWLCALAGSLQLTYMGFRAGGAVGSFYHQSINLVAGVLLLLTPLSSKQNAVTLLCVYLPPVLVSRIGHSSQFSEGIVFSTFMLYAGMMLLFWAASHEVDRLRQKAFQQKVSLFFLATTDSLSGLKLRRYFFNRFIQELSLKFRTVKEIALSVAIFDLDHFKQINDRHGHDVGDQCIKHVAEIIRHSVRVYDVACRFGGEEFVLLFPDTPRKDAKTVCENILKKVAETPWRDGKAVVPITLSAGISGIECAIPPAEEKESPERDNRFLLVKHMMRVIKSADKSLYEAKRGGRNRVCLAETVFLEYQLAAEEMLECQDYLNYFEEPFYLPEPQSSAAQHRKSPHEFNEYSEEFFFRRCVESVYRWCRNPDWMECLVLIRLKSEDAERAGRELRKTIRLADAVCSMGPGLFGVIFSGMKEPGLDAFLNRLEERFFMLHGQRVTVQLAAAPLRFAESERFKMEGLSSYRPLTLRVAELLSHLKRHRFKEDEKIFYEDVDSNAKKMRIAV